MRRAGTPTAGDLNSDRRGDQNRQRVEIRVKKDLASHEDSECESPSPLKIRHGRQFSISEAPGKKADTALNSAQGGKSNNDKVYASIQLPRKSSKLL